MLLDRVTKSDAFNIKIEAADEELLRCLEALQCYTGDAKDRSREK